MYRLLIVEDDKGIAEAIKAQAELWNLQVHCVQNFRTVMTEFAASVPILEHRGALLNTGDNTLTYGDEKISLSKNEFRILLILMENKGRIVSREKLMEKEHQKVIYYNLLTSGKLSSYLSEISEQAEKRYELITEQMKKAQGITEQLKAENILEWTGQMNNIRLRAMEIVNKEIIYAQM